MLSHDQPFCDPTDCSLPGSSVHGILQERILELIAIPSPGALPDPGIEPELPALAGGFFASKPSGRPFSSVSQLCPTLCNPMDCSSPGLYVHHQLLELTQTYVHSVGDAIQPHHPLWSPSPTFNLSINIRVFSNESVLCISIEAKVLKLQHQSFQ